MVVTHTSNLTDVFTHVQESYQRGAIQSTVDKDEFIINGKSIDISTENTSPYLNGINYIFKLIVTILNKV